VWVSTEEESLGWIASQKIRQKAQKRKLIFRWFEGDSKKAINQTGDRLNCVPKIKYWLVPKSKIRVLPQLTQKISLRRIDFYWEIQKTFEFGLWSMGRLHNQRKCNPNSFQLLVPINGLHPNWDL